MPQPNRLPVPATIAQAWRLLGRHLPLHAKAIWPPVVFLVAAEFTYHRIFGNADTMQARWQALLSHPWWMPVLAVFCWLAGLKFLLSFSISWRRHLLSRERFDPFFFKKPFWKYLALLVATYVWLIALYAAAVTTGGTIVAALSAGKPIPSLDQLEINGQLDMTRLFGSVVPAFLPLIILAVLATCFALWAIVRQVPFFTALTQDPPHPTWSDSTRAMRGQVWRYLLVFVATMLPVVLANAALDALLKAVGADRHAVPVALGESVFRQAMLFLHFSLGASIGALVFINRFGAPPREIATEGSRRRFD